MTDPHAILLDPPASAWASMLARPRERRAVSFRAELGLPADRPVVMSGHQPGFWHPGILAKRLALAHLCAASGAGGAWVVVDQDASDGHTLAYPRRDPAAPLGIARAVWPALADGPAHQRADIAGASSPAASPSAPPIDAATPDAARGLRAVHECLARHAEASSSAAQRARANEDLLASLLGPSENHAACPLLFASRLARTRGFASIVETMLDDPERCARAYNDAVAASPSQSGAPLTIARGQVELPLWDLGTSANLKPRKRVFAHTLPETPIERLAPRALLLTGVLRWLGCDLFIHGTGGGASDSHAGYDRAAEIWFHAWLGVTLTPSVVATATLHLPMGRSPSVTPGDLRAATHAAHAAGHTPLLLGDADAQAKKDALLAQLRVAVTREEKHRCYRAMHALLDRCRASHAGTLASLADRAAAIARTLGDESILRERAWPWPLYPRPMLLQLSREIAVAFRK